MSAPKDKEKKSASAWTLPAWGKQAEGYKATRQLGVTFQALAKRIVKRRELFWQNMASLEASTRRVSPGSTELLSTLLVDSANQDQDATKSMSRFIA